MAQKYVPCLVCDPNLHRDPEIEFLQSAHHQTHGPNLPHDHESYLKWVSEEYELAPAHPVFEPGGLTVPDQFEEFEYLFEQ